MNDSIRLTNTTRGSGTAYVRCVKGTNRAIEEKETKEKWKENESRDKNTARCDQEARSEFLSKRIHRRSRRFILARLQSKCILFLLKESGTSVEMKTPDTLDEKFARSGWLGQR